MILEESEFNATTKFILEDLSEATQNRFRPDLG